MNITSTPNLKPMRLINPHEIINGLYTANVGTLQKGTFVSIVSATGNNNVVTGASSPATPHVGVVGNWGEAPSYAISKRWAVRDTVRAALSGDVPLGVTLNDVAESDQFGINYAYSPEYRRQEQQVVLSGESVPILTRGIIMVNGYQGTPVPGSGATLNSGLLVVAPYAKSVGCVGKWLKGADPDGYAMFKVEL